jgi:hypothetical protein
MLTTFLLKSLKPTDNLNYQDPDWKAISVLYTKQTAGYPDVNSKEFKFSLQDGSRGLHISESTVGITYRFR